jgi:16S rRNA processing protein RimM
MDAETLFLKKENQNGLKKYRVNSAKPHKKIVLLKLEGVDHIDDAEALRGAEIHADRERLKAKQEDEYFWYELIGLDVFSEKGENLGKIIRIIPTPGNDIYLVKKEKQEILVPAVHEVVKEVRVEKNRMIIQPMEGMLDLNEV